MGTTAPLERINRVIALLRDGRSLRTACNEAEVPPGDVLDRVEKNKRLRERFEAARRVSLAVAEDALFENVLKGNATAQQFYLCNRAPDRWRPNSAAKADDGPPSEHVTPAQLLARYTREDQEQRRPKPKRVLQTA